MTKSELIALLAADPAVIGNHLTARDVDDAVNSILNAMTAALAQGSRIEIRVSNRAAFFSVLTQ